VKQIAAEIVPEVNRASFDAAQFLCEHRILYGGCVVWRLWTSWFNWASWRLLAIGGACEPTLQLDDLVRKLRMRDGLGVRPRIGCPRVIESNFERKSVVTHGRQGVRLGNDLLVAW